MVIAIEVLVEGNVEDELVVSLSEAEIVTVYTVEAEASLINPGEGEATVALVGSIDAEVLGG
jgi:hypothetical protein